MACHYLVAVRNADLGARVVGGDITKGIAIDGNSVWLQGALRNKALRRGKISAGKVLVVVQAVKRVVLASCNVEHIVFFHGDAERSVARTVKVDDCFVGSSLVLGSCRLRQVLVWFGRHCLCCLRGKGPMRW